MRCWCAVGQGSSFWVELPLANQTPDDADVMEIAPALSAGLSMIRPVN
jgi:hypothetical protein